MHWKVMFVKFLPEIIVAKQSSSPVEADAADAPTSSPSTTADIVTSRTVLIAAHSKIHRWRLSQSTRFAGLRTVRMGRLWTFLVVRGSNSDWVSWEHITPYTQAVPDLFTFRVGIAEAKCILAMVVCVFGWLSLAAFPHYCTDPDVTWRNGSGAL